MALAVVAVALPALLLTLSQQLDGTGYLQKRSIAQLVAANRLSELRLVVSAKGSLQPGLMSGQSEMGHQIWHWWSEGKETQIPGFFHYEVVVSDREDGRSKPVHKLDGYLAH